MKEFITQQHTQQIARIYMSHQLLRTLIGVTIGLFLFGFASSAHAAISFVGSNSATGNSGSYSVSLTSLTGGVGSAASEGDLVIVLSSFVSTSNGNPGVGTAGYTEEQDLYANDTRDANMSVSWKFMTATPDTTVSCNGSGSATNGAACIVYVWRGVDTSTPFDVAEVAVTGIDSAIPDPGSITPSTSGAYVLIFGAGTGSAADASVTVPAGYSNHFSTTVDPGKAIVAAVASKAWTSGAENPAARTGWTTSTSDSWAAVTMALRPAPVTVISGTVYKNNRVTPLPNKLIAVRTSSSAFATTTTNSNGEWSVPAGALGLDDETSVIVWVDGEQRPVAAVVTNAAGNDSITGLDMYEGSVIVRSEDNDPVTDTDMLFFEGGAATISSAVDQVFSVGQATTSVATITVTDGAGTPTITAANDLRITIDTAKTDMLWDTTDTTAIFGGAASSRVSNPVSYENGGTTLVIPVSSDFSSGEALTISGLSFVQFGAINVATSSVGLMLDEIVEGGTEWTSQTSAADNLWRSVTYGEGLFVAVSSSGTGNRVMTSPDGVTWTSRTSAADYVWRSVTYGNGIFVAVADNAHGVTVMTSPDGVTWTGSSAANANAWQSVTYADGLFVAVANAGTATTFRVMTSTNGTSWTSRTSAASNAWNSVTYGEGLFVAVSSSGTGNRVMTSPDGVTWTSRTSAADNLWRSVTYGEGLFVAVSSSGTGNRVMTSPDGVTWTSQTSAADNSWQSVTYADGLFVAVSSSGTGNRVMISSEGAQPPRISDDKTVTITGSLVMSNHDAGQVENAFSYQNQDDAPLLAFKLTPNGEELTVGTTTIPLAGIRRIDESNLSDLRLYRDTNADGGLDGGDVQIGGQGVLAITDQTGSITFTGDWISSTTENFILVGDVSDIKVNEFLTMDIIASSFDAVGDVVGVRVPPYGSVTAVQHIRGGGGAGGGANGSAEIGEPAPEGDGDVGGGGAGGGGGIGDEDEGETGEGANIGNEVGFEPPSSTGSQHNQWTNGANAYVSDNQHATAASIGHMQSYGGFGFSVPQGTTIVGIAVKVETRGSEGGGNAVALSWNGGAQYTEDESMSLTGTEAVFLVGGANETWGRTWTPSEFNNGNFLLRITSYPGPEGTNYVDAIQVRVYHQAGGGGGGGGGEI